jgi:hypothetical protein
MASISSAVIPLRREAQVLNTPRREGAGDQATEPRVVGRVHEQEAARAVGVGSVSDLGRGVLLLVRRQPGMAQHGGHLGMTQGEPDRVGDAQQRRGAAETFIEG